MYIPWEGAGVMMKIGNKNTGPDFKQNNNPGLVFY
jgi:hypothetical protein